MNTSLFSRQRSAPPRFPDGAVGFAIGDVHGRADLLSQMLDRIESEAARSGAPTTVIFLGDYIDRGPQSFETVELLLSDRLPGAEKHFLMGNHEQAMLEFLQDPVSFRAWLSHGGLETMASYGVAQLPALGAGPDALEDAAQALLARMPVAHREFFLTQLERWVVLGDYLFVHAGVDPGRALEDQTDRELLWIRDRFLNDKRSLPYVVVHGHTPADAPFRDHRRIGLDTGAYFTSALSAARFEGEDVTFLSTTDTWLF